MESASRVNTFSRPSVRGDSAASTSATAQEKRYVSALEQPEREGETAVPILPRVGETELARHRGERLAPLLLQVVRNDDRRDDGHDDQREDEALHVAQAVGG